MEVKGIRNGIVLDHIEAGKGLKIFEKLELASLPHSVVLLMNVPSSRVGKKDIIKIENLTEINLDVLGLIDSHLTINIIEEYSLVHKRTVEIPKEISGLFDCSNPRCVTNYDKSVSPKFKHVSSNGKIRYRCQYCQEVTEYRI